MSKNEIAEVTLFSLAVKLDQLGNMYLEKQFVTPRDIKFCFHEDIAPEFIEVLDMMNEATISIEKSIMDMLSRR